MWCVKVDSFIHLSFRPKKKKQLYQSENKPVRAYIKTVASHLKREFSTITLNQCFVSLCWDFWSWLWFNDIQLEYTLSAIISASDFPFSRKVQQHELKTNEQFQDLTFIATG